MLAANNQGSADLPAKNAAEDAVERGDDFGVPPSERGKAEQMWVERKYPSWVFIIVGVVFFLVLMGAVLITMAYLNVTTPAP